MDNSLNSKTQGVKRYFFDIKDTYRCKQLHFYNPDPDLNIDMETDYLMCMLQSAYVGNYYRSEYGDTIVTRETYIKSLDAKVEILLCDHLKEFFPVFTYAEVRIFDGNELILIPLFSSDTSQFATAVSAFVSQHFGHHQNKGFTEVMEITDDIVNLLASVCLELKDSFDLSTNLDNGAKFDINIEDEVNALFDKMWIAPFLNKIEIVRNKMLGL